MTAMSFVRSIAIAELSLLVDRSTWDTVWEVEFKAS
jgi:hypothetical protein